MVVRVGTRYYERALGPAPCMSRILAKDPSRIADIPFWARTKFDTPPSPSLAATPYSASKS